jgi:hypothetical protein
VSDVDYVRGRIALLRPRAKFAAYSHSSDFIDGAANLGDGFHYVALYDEKVDSNVIEGPRGLILIHNTYLASFAYNLFLCWLLRSADSQRDAGPDLAVLLTHNFKKFFAEQLLHGYDNLFARAVFLETLLYEQVCMVPVFEAKSRNPDLGRMADLGADLMSSVVSFHELGHYFLERDPDLWNDIVKQHPVLEPIYAGVAQAGYPPAFLVEFKCDVMAVISCLQQYEEKGGREFCLKAVAFAFAAFAVLHSLVKSAESTSANHRRSPDSVDFRSIEKVHRDFDFVLGIDRDFAERARLMILLCDHLMQAAGTPLFTGSGEFFLPESILDDLLLYIDRIMESDDRNARDMSLLVAEALHEHPRGVEFLYLRSKTFSSNWELPDRV